MTLDVRQRKPLVSPSSGDGEGHFSDTPQPAHQLVPSEPPRAGCPVNPRPRNLPEYKAACRAAEGASVVELNACQVMPDRSVYHNGRFLIVLTQERGDPNGHVELWLAGPGVDAVRVADMDAPIYCLA